MKWIIFAFVLGCGGVAYPPCQTPKAVRCADGEAQRCEGGHWYPDMDCEAAGMACELQQDDTVVRCVLRDEVTP